ncbi:hypothetical protein DsansV1_C13g0125371 [Dioscorea sansibarensis]
MRKQRGEFASERRIEPDRAFDPVQSTTLVAPNFVLLLDSIWSSSTS